MSKTLNPTLTALETAKYYCTLTTYEYKRPTPFAAADESPLRTFKLPLPMELRDETRVNYSGDLDMQAVGDIINNGILSPSTIGAEALRQAGQLGADAARGLAGSVADRLGASGAARQGIEESIGTALPAEALGSALQQSLGVAPNPNPSVAFRGPALRDLNLSWTFMPANRDEAANIRGLIRYLKAASLPKSSDGGASILSYPNLAQINFYPWDNSGTGRWGWGPNSIIKMKRCFMQAVNVEYNAGTAPAFFHDGNFEPVITRLNISFKEVEYFLSHDYGGDTRDLGDFGQLFGDLASLVGNILVGGNSGGVDENQRVEEEAAPT